LNRLIALGRAESVGSGRYRRTAANEAPLNGRLTEMILKVIGAGIGKAVYSARDIAKALNSNKDDIVEILENLVQAGLVQQAGNGRYRSQGRN
jgi:DNA-binding MarR family transcriptional regulator